ncbi:MAG: thiol:disulfide oxidoreductase [Comamonadaceae bacterium]|nr:MAG: thiol:disulfide oxidoreductase [Comamonadaceae bacterium]
MIELWYWPTPNGHKITMLLEEAGIDYEIHPVNIGKGEQFDPKFLAFSPNNRMPAIIDRDPADGGEPITVFESGAILIYLANKANAFNGGPDPRGKVAVVEWLMWQMGGLGPMLGQNHHFTRYAPEKVPYAIDRYVRETTRLYGVLDKRLEGREFIAGEYSIADMASYPWILPDIQGQDMADFPNLARWHAAIKARPATERAYAKGMEINPNQGAQMTEEQKKVLFGTPAKS